MFNGHELLLESLTKYFKANKDYEKILVELINGKHSISLRMLDWLVTHYAKANNIIYWIDSNTDYIIESEPINKDDAMNLKKIMLYIEYRAQLKSYTKFNFDPFRRRERIVYQIDENTTIETTIGQLNFFRWVFNNRLIDYAIKYNKTILAHMSTGKKNKDFNILNQKINYKSCVIVKFN